MARIRETLVQRAPDDDVEYPTYSAARAQSGDSPPRFAAEMYYQLEQANLNYDQVLAELSLVEAHMPLLGAFVNRFKRELHQLVVYYVNMVAERQVVVNDALVHTLNHLVKGLESSTVENLQDQLAELQERVQNLEARVQNGEAEG
jgi:hypothetical protein